MMMSDQPIFSKVVLSLGLEILPIPTGFRPLDDHPEDEQRFLLDGEAGGRQRHYLLGSGLV
jgi:hypothetical protein